MKRAAFAAIAAVRRHLLPLLAFGGLACAWSYPLVRELGNAVPGAGPGDNLTFLWNSWWMRHVLASPSEHFFFTRYLFAPFGTDLTLHTHTASLDWLAAVPLARLPLVPAFNVLVIGSLFLNAAAAYVLAWQLTRDRGAAFVGGVIFGGSPYIMAHLHGHLNLVAAWGLPLFAACLHRAFRDRSRTWSGLAGAVLACIAYTDYYYLVFAIIFAALYTLRSCGTLELLARPAENRRRWTVFALLALLVLVLSVAAVIAATGGWAGSVGGIRISVTRPTNVLTVAWALLFALLVYRRRVAVRVGVRVRDLRGSLLLLTPMAAVALVAALPLAKHGLELWLRGDYVSAHYLWRSSPAGIDLLALVGGNPFHPIWGDRIRRVSEAWHASDVEGIGWLGIAPLALLFWSLRHREAADGEQRTWLLIGGAFLLWSLGPFLLVAGVNTGLFLPAFLVRFVPIVANARIPARAMVMVYLALAVLASKALARGGGVAAGGARPLRVAAIAALVLFDFLAAPFPLYRLEVPRLYSTLRDQPESTRLGVCELPLGIRDGFGETGRLDHSTMYFQTVHGRPLTGGFVARMAPRLRQAIESNPALGRLLVLSARTPAATTEAGGDTPAQVEAELRRLGVGYIVLNRATAPEQLVRLVEQMPGLTRLTDDPPRELFALKTD